MEEEGSGIGAKRRRWFCTEDDDDSRSPKASRSSVILDPKIGHPLLLLSREDNECRVYNPEDDRIYETKDDFSGYRFLASSGKWFLAVDSRFDLYIIDVLSEDEDSKIKLPPLESLKGASTRSGSMKLERVDDTHFHHRYRNDRVDASKLTLDHLRGVLWVDHKTREYIVVWQFKSYHYLGYCKKSDEHYHQISTSDLSLKFLRGQQDMVLKGYNLYVYTASDFIRHLDLSGPTGTFTEMVDVYAFNVFPMYLPFKAKSEDEIKHGKKVIYISGNILVTASGEVLLLCTRCYETNETDSSQVRRSFHLFKTDPNDPSSLVELDSGFLGDREALFPDMGVSVIADPKLGGIKPNCLYFTRAQRFCRHKLACFDICIYNVATKTTTQDFPRLSKLELKDALWFIPS